MKQQSLTALTACLERVSVDDAPSHVLAPEMFEHARRLVPALTGEPADLEVHHVLGWFFWYRFLALEKKSLGDMKMAVMALAPCMIYGVEPLPRDLYPDIADEATSLAADLLRAALNSADLPLLDLAVDAWRRIEAATPTNHRDRTERLSALSAALYKRFEHAGSLADLDQATWAMEQTVRAMEETVRAAPADHTLRAGYLSNLAVALVTRFEHSGDGRDLDRALTSALQAEQASPMPTILSTLGTVLLRRFEHSGSLADLNRAIIAMEQAVQAAPAEDHDRGAYLSNLSGALVLRYGQTGHLADLNRAVVDGQQAMQITPNQHPYWAGCRAILAVSLAKRFEHTGSLEDLDQAISIGEQAVQATPDGHPDRAGYLSNLGLTLRQRFESTGSHTYLDQAISIGEQAVQATPSNSPNLAGHLSGLSMALLARFDRTGSLADLDQAITVGEQAARTTTAKRPERSIIFSNLGLALRQRFERTGKPADLDRAVVVGEEAVQATSAEHPDRAMCLCNLGLALQVRFEHTGVLADLDQAISVGEQAVQATSAEDPDRAMYLSYLGLALRMRFGRTGTHNDLDQAISVGEQAVKAAPAEHPDRARYLSYLGIALRMRFEKLGNRADLDRARKAFASAASMTNASIAQQIRANRSTGATALLAGDAPDALRAYAAAIELLPQLVPGSLTRSEREYELGSMANLGAEAAAAAVSAGCPQHAVELLEQSRGILADEVIATEVAVRQLQNQPRDLLAEFQQIRAERDHVDRESARPAPTGPFLGLDSEAVVASRASTLAEVHSRRLSEERRRVTGKWERLIARIRTRLPDFLMVPPIDELRKNAAAGPIITVSVTRSGGVALLLTDDVDVPVRAVPLDHLTENAAIRQVNRLLDAHMVLGDRSASADDKTTARSDLMDVLDWLWTNVTEPIWTDLMRAGWQGSRIWWCPVGAMTYLPLHATSYRTRVGSDAMDRVIFSYTPTIRALSHARRSHDPSAREPEGSALVVAMSTTPGLKDGGRLPGAAYEADMIESLVSGTRVFRNAQAIRTDVLDELSSYPVAHFACHGWSDWSDPGNSRLLLHDHQSEPLTVVDISQLRLFMADLAYLSACSTSETSPRLADEAVHITAAFQLAGYRHVIGTLWPVDDAIAVSIAESIYRSLTHNGTTPPDPERSAQALHEAVREIRGLYPDKPDLWAAHIHVGP